MSQRDDLLTLLAARSAKRGTFTLASGRQSSLYIGRRLRAKARRGGDALIGIPERELTTAGITRVPRVSAERGGLPLCGDRVLEPRVIVWCTGFVPDYRWIDLPVLDDSGYPRHENGASMDAPGLYFLGLRFQRRMSSSLVGGVGLDAAIVAEQIASRSDAELDAR